MVRFAELDGYLLWCLPGPGCELAYWVWAYTFVNRDAAPSFTELAGCVDRAVRAGVMPLPADGRYRLNPEWLQRVRAYDGGFSVPEEGMIAFQEWLSGEVWPEVSPVGFALGHEEYEAAALGHPRYAEPGAGEGTITAEG
jgi:hypothetical protein